MSINLPRERPKLKSMHEELYVSYDVKSEAAEQLSAADESLGH